MTFEKFIENMRNNIKNYLPEDYQDAEILIRKVQNINRTYTGLNIHKKDQVYAACISLFRSCRVAAKDQGKIGVFDRRRFISFFFRLPDRIG